MSSRIEIELTSEIDADLYTWRALGAKEPKGTIIKSLLPTDVSIGDTFRVEADFLIDGIEIIRVLPKREERKEQETIEILGSGDEKYGVTTQLIKKKSRNVTKERLRTRDRRKTGIAIGAGKTLRIIEVITEKFVQLGAHKQVNGLKLSALTGSRS